jgi:hypothetical protein
VQEVVFSIVIVDHRTCVRLDCDTPFSFHVQPIQRLLQATLLDRPRELQQAITQSTLSMIDVRNDAEVPEAVDGDLLNALLEIRLQLCGQAWGGCVEFGAILDEFADMCSGRLIS